MIRLSNESGNYAIKTTDEDSFFLVIPGYNVLKFKTKTICFTSSFERFSGSFCFIAGILLAIEEF
jgi:hypothetical protein